MNLSIKKKILNMYIRAFHNHETSHTHWDCAAKINPFNAVCASAQSLADISKVKDSVLFHGGIDFRGKDLLDVCCGVGRIARFVSKNVASYTGVDWSKTMIDTARNIHKNEVNVKFILNNGVDLSGLLENSFDVAVCELAFQHMEHVSTERYVREVLRVLKPSGVFLAQIPRCDFYDNYSESKGRGYDLEGAKAIFKGYSKIEHIDGYNHNYAYFLIKATKGTA